MPGVLMHTHHVMPITPLPGSGAIAAPNGCRGIYREVGVLRLAYGSRGQPHLRVARVQTGEPVTSLQEEFHFLRRFEKSGK